MKIQKNKKKTGSYNFRIKTLMMSIYRTTVKVKKVPIVIAMKNHLKKTKKIIQIVHNKKNNEEN
jgi:hypothetical protein